mgnify:FL=1
MFGVNSDYPKEIQVLMKISNSHCHSQIRFYLDLDIFKSLKYYYLIIHYLFMETGPNPSSEPSNLRSTIAWCTKGFQNQITIEDYNSGNRSKIQGPTLKNGKQN